MEPIYTRLQQRARQIVSSFPLPEFYSDHYRAFDCATQFFKTDPVLKKLHRFVAEHLENDFGHGLQHATKVTLDAGALMHIEAQATGYSKSFLNRRLRVVQCAGLLHDIKRKAKNHAETGADHARGILRNYPLEVLEVEDVCLAIRNHEAFKIKVPIDTPEGGLVSDCLYDADKFRWGPDNFTDTIWDMISFNNPPLSEFMGRYPKGMESLAKIKPTFRTATGKKYGPQFIDLGLAIGQELYETIQSEFSQYL
jgi:hypothetical protein